MSNRMLLIVLLISLSACNESVISQNRIETVQALISKGADLEKGGDSNTTPLMYASSAGYAKTVKVLIDHGAHVNAKDEDGDTAVAYAAIRGAPVDVIKQLLNAGADVN